MNDILARIKCVGTTKSGRCCTQPARRGHAFCIQHDPDSREALKLRMSVLGKGGGASSAAKRMALRRMCEGGSIPLSTLDEIRAFLQSESAAARALNEPSRANAAARIATVARDLLPIADLQRENAELRRLLLKHCPHAASELRVVK